MSEELDTFEHFHLLVLNEIQAALDTVGITNATVKHIVHTKNKEADASFLVFPFAKQLRQKPDDIACAIADALIPNLTDETFIQRCWADKGYVHFEMNRLLTVSHYARLMESLGHRYGFFGAVEGERVVIEHTSSNPNAPLHVGNIRNSLLGDHFARILRACGADVDEIFFVNDCGAQIGLTVLAYREICDHVPVEGKFDHWIGIVYAGANTVNDLQMNHCDLNVLLPIFDGVSVDSLTIGPEAISCETDNIEEVLQKVKASTEILADLYSRFPDLIKTIFMNLKDRDVPREAADLNLKYEANDPETVRIFRRMVNQTLGAVVETLQRCHVSHESFDYESELLWDGTLDIVSDILKKSPYFTPATATRGGFLDLERYIHDRGFKTGKGGYSQAFPPLFIFRPDGSTIYYLRDIAYTMHKLERLGDAEEGKIFNVIASEQGQPQQKVKLGLSMLSDRYEALEHFQYEMVHLVGMKMSGRRGRYLLTDDLLDEMQEIVEAKTRETFESRYPGFEETEVSSVCARVAEAALKWGLLCSSPNQNITFNPQAATSLQNKDSGVFVLYNVARIRSILREDEPSPIEEVDFGLITRDEDWTIFLDQIVKLSFVIKQACSPTGTHVIVNTLSNFVQRFSSYYKKTRVLVDDPALRNARLQMLKMLHQVYVNLLSLVGIEPVDRM